jgi:hypothetical protein
MNNFIRKNIFSLILLTNITIFILYFALRGYEGGAALFVFGQTSINALLGSFFYDKEYPNLKEKDNFKESIYEGAILSAIIFFLIGFGVCTFSQ